MAVKVLRRKQGVIPTKEEQDKIIEEAKTKEALAPQKRVTGNVGGLNARDRLELATARAGGKQPVMSKGVLNPPTPEEINKAQLTEKNKGLAAEDITKLNQPTQLTENITDNQGVLVNRLTKGVSEDQSNLGKIATMGSNVIQDISTASAAGAVGWGVGTGLLALPTFSTIAPKVLGNTKLARQMMRFVGVGSLAGITTKLGIGKRQAVTDANTIFSDAKSNIGTIISSLNSKAITPQEATELFNNEIENLDLSERALKQLTKGNVTSFLSGGKDEMTKLQNYKYGNGLLLDRKALELSINNYYGVVPQ